VAAEKTIDPSRTKTSPVISNSSGSGTKAEQKPAVPRKTEPVKTFAMPSLNLEGVAYSEASKDRFAIINGTIVREGESIGGLMVTRIYRNHVDVRSRDGSFKSRLMIQ